MNMERHTITATEPGQLAPDEVQELSRHIPEWSVEKTEMHREFTFGDFPQAIQFVNRVAALAQEADHHPDIMVSYNTVRLTLSTHKAGGLTVRDFDLARKINFLER